MTNMTDNRTALAERLAQAIRIADGNHGMGAAALAEALVPFVEREAAQALRADAGAVPAGMVLDSATLTRWQTLIDHAPSEVQAEITAMLATLPGDGSAQGGATTGQVPEDSPSVIGPLAPLPTGDDLRAALVKMRDCGIQMTLGEARDLASVAETLCDGAVEYEVRVQYLPAGVVLDDDNVPEPAGLFMCDAEYPEEGWIPIRATAATPPASTQGDG